MVCKFIKKCAVIALSLVLALTSVRPVFAEKSTSEKLKDAEKEQSETEDKIEETSDKIDALKDTKESLQKDLKGLNSELASVTEKITEIEDRIQAKEGEIEETEREITEAEEEKATRYRYIKARIRTLYEKGKENYVELFLQTTNFGEFLNRAEYISRVNQYDQEMLENFRILIEETKEKKVSLETDRQELESLKEDAVAEQEKVKNLVNRTKNSITAYAGEISEAEAEALAYEARLIAAKNNVNTLKEQLRKEEELARLSQSMKKRSLSEVAIGAGEKEMLAALIQCEAGGEPWAGKIAVGAVVMNRVMSGAFPNTIAGVIYQPGQFEPVSSGRFAIVLGQGANAECTRAAEAAMAGTNNIGECLFFRTIVPGINGTIIGHHVFYLYWTGKYSGYGTADESLADGQEAARQNAEENGVPTEPDNGSSSDNGGAPEAGGNDDNDNDDEEEEEEEDDDDDDDDDEDEEEHDA